MPSVRAGGRVAEIDPSRLAGVCRLTKYLHRYNMTQVASVLLVTAGVVLTTLSASKPKAKAASTSYSAESVLAGGPSPTMQYATGIAILSLALVAPSSPSSRTSMR